VAQVEEMGERVARRKAWDGREAIVCWVSVDRWLGRGWLYSWLRVVVDIIILLLRLPRGARSAGIFLGNFNDSLADGNPFDSSALAI
jgi:hypothetical protein